MAAEVLSAIGLDISSPKGGLIGIREEHGSDAHFIISCLLSKYVQAEYNVCFVTLHNTFHHYHNVGMKLGYNLNALKEKGAIKTIEAMKLVLKDSSYENLKKVLLKEIEDNVEEMLKSDKHVLLIIDDLSHLFEMEFTLSEILMLIKQVKSLIYSNPGNYAILNVHVSSEYDLVVANLVQHSSNTHVCISPLKTGFSSNVSGKMEISEMNAQTKENLWNKQSLYHYKLHDRFVKVFAPGLVS
ncbi:elongator complex protein 6-like [Ctenocephalides felis]|uniref:elongator complex protein 6-like n=1 Tax=Ctenocephalides felis TaxID=7515 RepID=UPI000E6E2D3C|nr:elongator complex protein 6-like [Ctenocephalides felis]